MITFKSNDDLNKLSTDDPAHPIISELVESLINAYTWPGHPYIASDYGYIILLEEGDTDRSLDEIWEGCRLINIMWEGITQKNGMYTMIYLANNEYGLCFVLPDADWIDSEFRKLIEDIVDP